VASSVLSVRECATDPFLSWFHFLFLVHQDCVSSWPVVRLGVLLVFWIGSGDARGKKHSARQPEEGAGRSNWPKVPAPPVRHPADTMSPSTSACRHELFEKAKDLLTSGRGFSYQISAAQGSAQPKEISYIPRRGYCGRVSSNSTALSSDRRGRYPSRWCARKDERFDERNVPTAEVAAAWGPRSSWSRTPRGQRAGCVGGARTIQVPRCTALQPRFCDDRAGYSCCLPYGRVHGPPT